MENNRDSVERALSKWKQAVEEFGVSAGVVDSAFKRMYRDQFKQCEVVLASTSHADLVLGRLIKFFESGSKTLRWRAAYLIGEVARLHPQASRKGSAVGALLKYLQSPEFFVRSNEGTEVIASLGKSEDSRAAQPLLKILKARWSEASSVPHVFVSLGKVGNAETVESLTQFMSRPKLSNSARIYLPWAIGMLGRLDCGRDGFPLPRPPFRGALKQLQQVIESPPGHLDQYRYAIYAMGRICDQRQAVLRPTIELEFSDISMSRRVLEHKRNRYSGNGNQNSKQIARMIEMALTMIEGAELSSDQIILLEKVETI